MQKNHGGQLQKINVEMIIILQMLNSNRLGLNPSILICNNQKIFFGFLQPQY